MQSPVVITATKGHAAEPFKIPTLVFKNIPEVGLLLISREYVAVLTSCIALMVSIRSA